MYFFSFISKFTEVEILKKVQMVVYNLNLRVKLTVNMLGHIVSRNAHSRVTQNLDLREISNDVDEEWM